MDTEAGGDAKAEGREAEAEGREAEAEGREAEAEGREAEAEGREAEAEGREAEAEGREAEAEEGGSKGATRKRRGPVKCAIPHSLPVIARKSQMPTGFEGLKLSDMPSVSSQNPLQDLLKCGILDHSRNTGFDLMAGSVGAADANNCLGQNAIVLKLDEVKLAILNQSRSTRTLSSLQVSAPPAEGEIELPKHPDLVLLDAMEKVENAVIENGGSQATEEYLSSVDAKQQRNFDFLNSKIDSLSSKLDLVNSNLGGIQQQLDRMVTQGIPVRIMDPSPSPATTTSVAPGTLPFAQRMGLGVSFSSPGRRSPASSLRGFSPRPSERGDQGVFLPLLWTSLDLTTCNVIQVCLALIDFIFKTFSGLNYLQRYPSLFSFDRLHFQNVPIASEPVSAGTERWEEKEKEVEEVGDGAREGEETVEGEGAGETSDEKEGEEKDDEIEHDLGRNEPAK